MAAKYWSCTPAQLKGPRSVLPPLTFFGFQASDFAFRLVLDAGRGVGRGRCLIAETGRPGWVGLDALAVLRDGNFYVKDVAVVETKGLANGDTAVGVLVGQLARGGDCRLAAGDVERGVQLVTQLVVVGVEAERQSVLRGCRVDQVQRLTLSRPCISSAPTTWPAPPLLVKTMR